MIHRTTAYSLLLLIVATLTGCQPPKATEADRPRPEPIDYATLAQRFNARVEPIEQLWSRAVVEVEWTDEEGKRHFEQGDGPLIIRKPRDLALAIGKLGNTIYWLGSNEDQYWLFDLNDRGDQQKVAYVGRHANVGRPCSEPLPIPIPPHQLSRLSGLTALPATEPAGASLQIEGGFYVLSYPAESFGEPLRWRYWIDPQTARPERVAIVDRAGEVVTRASLSRWELLPLGNAPRGAWPYIPSRIELTIPERQATATLFLDQITDGREGNKVRDVQFDFDRLVRSLKPEEVVVLDAECQ